jgi:hypothetical protein
MVVLMFSAFFYYNKHGTLFSGQMVKNVPIILIYGEKCAHEIWRPREWNRVFHEILHLFSIGINCLRIPWVWNWNAEISRKFCSISQEFHLNEGFHYVLTCPTLHPSYPEMKYCEIKEMSSLYFGLAVFCLLEARTPEFDPQPLHPPPRTAVDCTLNTASNSGTLASNWQSTSSPQYNNGISLLI